MHGNGLGQGDSSNLRAVEKKRRRKEVLCISTCLVKTVCCTILR
jgi:hypothetical protein